MSNKLNGFIFLLLVILFGSVGHFCLKKSYGFVNINFVILCLLFFVIKIYYVSKAYTLLSMGIVNSLYSAFIILFTTILGLLFYKEKLNMYSTIGVLCIMVGVVLIQLNN